MKIEKNVNPPERTSIRGKYDAVYAEMDSLNPGESMSVRVGFTSTYSLRTNAYKHAADYGYKISTTIDKGTLYITRKEETK